MFSYSGLDSATIAMELINLLVFCTVGVTLLVKSHEIHAPRTRRFALFCFFWAGSQFFDLVLWFIMLRAVPDWVLIVLNAAEALLIYVSFFMFLNLTLMMVEGAVKIDLLWKYCLYLGLLVVVVSKSASYITASSNESFSTITKGIYLALSTIVLAAEFFMAISYRKMLLKVEVYAISFYTLGEMIVNLVIDNSDLCFAGLSSVAALFSIMIFGAIIQRLMLQNMRDNTNALAQAYGEREKVEETVKQMSQTLDKYVGHDVAEILLNEQIVHGENRQVTIFFADIEGFTTLCESYSPQDVMSILNLYLETMANAVLANEGTIDKFIGDCTMALWNAALEQPEGPYQACRAALAIRNGVKVVNQIIEREYDLHLEVNIGINLGTAVIGNFGSAERKSFTAVGDSVNVAARIQDLADHGEILVSRTIMESVGERGVFAQRDSVLLKGKTKETEVFELISLKD